MKKRFGLKNAILSLVLIIFTLVLFGCSPTDDKTSLTSDIVNGIRVSYIDVGQADSILIQQGEHSMLIDGGTNEAADTVVSYLRQNGVTKLDYIIATHPHEDHIGGLDKVIQEFDAGSIYMPKVTANTRTFRDLVAAISEKNVEVKKPVPGQSFTLGDAKCIILAPNSDSYEDLNNYSIVLKVAFGSSKFLFTGDAGEPSEEEILKKGYDVSADFLKVGHHGSHTSTSLSFLNRINPKVAIISLGLNNDYGHPHKETLDKLNKKGIQILRTDQSGTITIESDGKGNVSIGKSKTGSSEKINITNNKTEKSSQGPDEKKYVDSKGRGLIKGNINSKGEKIYHIPGDRYYNSVKPEMWFKTTSEAEKAGFRHSKS